MNTTFTGEATNRWITAMKDDAFDAVEEAVAAATEESKLNFSMAAVIDRLFDNFKRYSFEYNRTQEDREFEINCERPASMRTTAEYADSGKPIKFCLGHLASRHWSLIVQGEENRVLVYITPIEFLVGFKPGAGEFTPHMEMRLARDTAKASREFVWSIAGQPLSQDSLPVLARRLFTQLVKVTKGEANYGEPFTLSPQEEKVAMARPAQIDRSFEDDDSMFLGQKKPALAERTFVVASGDNGVAEPASDFTVNVDRPQFNALLSPTAAPAPAAASNYPQVAAAIANGEPKALQPPVVQNEDIPAKQSYAEQAQTFPKLPVQTQSLLGSAGKPAGDEAIAALIFPAPETETQAVSHAEPTTSSVPVFATTPKTAAPQTGSNGWQNAVSQPQTSSPSLASTAHSPTPTFNPTPNLSGASPNLAPTPSPAGAPAPAHTPNPPSHPELAPAPVSSFTPTTTGASAPQAQRMETTAQHWGQQSDGRNNGEYNLAKEIAASRADVAQTLKTLFDSLDSSIDRLSALGLEAMHADDLTTVSGVMKQTKTLKTMRDNVVALSKEWQKTSN